MIFLLLGALALIAFMGFGLAVTGGDLDERRKELKLWEATDRRRAAAKAAGDPNWWKLY